MQIEASPKADRQDLIDMVNSGLHPEHFTPYNAQHEIDRIENILGDYDGRDGTYEVKKAYNDIIDYLEALEAMVMREDM